MRLHNPPNFNPYPTVRRGGGPVGGCPRPPHSIWAPEAALQGDEGLSNLTGTTAGTSSACRAEKTGEGILVKVMSGKIIITRLSSVLYMCVCLLYIPPISTTPLVPNYCPFRHQ